MNHNTSKVIERRFFERNQFPLNWNFLFSSLLIFAALNLSYSDHGTKITVSVVGALKEYCSNVSDATQDCLIVSVRNEDKPTIGAVKVYGIDRSSYDGEVMNTMTFDFYPDIPQLMLPQSLNLTISMRTTSEYHENPIAFQLIVDPNAVLPEIGVTSAVIILIFFNVLLGTEVNMLCRLNYATLFLPKKQKKEASNE